MIAFLAALAIAAAIAGSSYAAAPYHEPVRPAAISRLVKDQSRVPPGVIYPIPVVTESFMRPPLPVAKPQVVRRAPIKKAMRKLKPVRYVRASR